MTVKRPDVVERLKARKGLLRELVVKTSLSGKLKEKHCYQKLKNGLILYQKQPIREVWCLIGYSYIVWRANMNFLI